MLRRASRVASENSPCVGSKTRPRSSVRSYGITLIYYWKNEFLDLSTLRTQYSVSGTQSTLLWSVGRELLTIQSTTSVRVSERSLSLSRPEPISSICSLCERSWPDGARSLRLRVPLGYTANRPYMADTRRRRLRPPRLTFLFIPVAISSANIKWNWSLSVSLRWRILLRMRHDHGIST